MFLKCDVEDSWDWTAISNQPILKEISLEYSSEGLMFKLKLQYFGHQQRTDSLEKTLMLRKIEVGEDKNEIFGWHHQRDCHEFE